MKLPIYRAVPSSGQPDPNVQNFLCPDTGSFFVFKGMIARSQNPYN